MARAITHEAVKKTTETLRHLTILDWIAILLVVVGGLNWGLVGIFSYDLVAGIFGELSSVSRIVYTLVGIASVYLVFSLPRINKG